MKCKKILDGVCVFLLVLSMFPSFSGTPTAAQGEDLIFYDDALRTGWDAAPWGDITVNLANTSPVQQGARSIAIDFNGGWAGTWLVNWNEGVNLDGRDALRFWIYATENGHPIVFTFHFTDDSTIERTVVPSQTGQWVQIEESLVGYTAGLELYGIQIFNDSDSGHGIFYLDQIVAGDSMTPPPSPIVGPALSVDAAAGQHLISPYIYGMSFTEEGLADEVQLPVRRWGGNSTTRYNWQTNVHNVGSDWYFENIPNDGSADEFVEQNNRTGSATLMTLPLIGWTPKTGPTAHPFDCGFKISKYGDQDDADWNWDPDCGNGRQGGVNITGNDPLDTSIAITSSYVTNWINHLTTEYGTAANGGVQFYSLDNEPMLWSSTHRDVHPAETTAAEMQDRTYTYAAAIKAADPTAQTLGPVTWGWCAYFCSDAGNCCSPDAGTTADQGRFTEWYLEQMQAYEITHSVRILDYLDVHYYPAADGVALSGPGGDETKALRLRSTRSLWDPTYHDESWIEDTTDEPIQMIRRMKQWVADNYPGTKTSITEYNWGAANHINGALAEADVLGIFGREGLDMATLWGPPTGNQPLAYAFRMYRNYDGNGATFGDISVQATSADQEQLSVYAARRSSDGALTVMVVNKAMRPLTSTLSLANYQAGALAQVYRYDQENVAAIVRLADQPLSGNGFTTLFPMNSITLIVLAPAGGAVTGVTIDGPTEGWTGENQDFTALVTPVDASTPVTYTWSPTPDAGQGTATATYNWDAAGSKTITVTAQNATGGPVSDSHVITISVPVVPVDSVTISGPTSGVVNTTYTFAATVSPANASTPITYTWTPAPLSGQGMANAAYSWGADGSYTITVTAENGSGQATDTHVIVIGAAPVPVDSVTIAGPTSGDVGANYVFTATVSPANATEPITYTWTPAPAAGQGTANAAYLWGAAGSQTITVTVENGSGQATDNHTIVVSAVTIPLVSVTISGPTSGAVDTPYSFSAAIAPTNATPPITYTWSPEPDSGQGTATATYSWNAVGRQTITVTAENASNALSDHHAIAIAAAPIPVDSVEITGPTGGMVNTSYAFAAEISPTNATAPITYTWYPTPNGGQGTATASYAWITPGSKTIMVNVQSAGSDVTDNHIIVIAVVNTPVDAVEIAGPTSGVVDTGYTFTAAVSPTNATTPITYTWSPAPASGQGTAAATYSWAVTGTQAISVTADNGSGAAVGAHTIEIFAASIPVQSVEITGPISGVVNLSYGFTAVLSPTNATAPLTYTWYPAPVSGQNTATANYSWANTGAHTITVTVENDGGSAGNTHTLVIEAGSAAHRIYLPVVLR